MGLWCGHAVLPFPSFDLVFLFHLLGQVALALVTFFELSLLSLLFFLSSLSPGSVWFWFGCAFSEFFLCLCSDFLFLFSSGFPASTCASQVLFFILLILSFSVGLRDYFLGSSFLLFRSGGLAWAFCLQSCIGVCGLFSWLWEDSFSCLSLGR